MRHCERNRSPVARRVVLALAALCSLSTLLRASQVRPVNLEEMSGRAARIFSGRCLDVRVERDAALGIEVTVVRLHVDRVAKGRMGRTVTLRLPGATTAGALPTSSVAGLPAFRRGEEVVLFLYGESRAGLTSPIGLGQGKFSVIADKQGRRSATNGFDNRILFRGLSSKAAGRLGQAARAWEAGRGLPPDSLLDMAETLAR